jgi:spermidine/putrescine-binding protein
MSDHPSSERSSRSYTRGQIVKGALGTGAVLGGLGPLAAACGGGGGSSGGGSGGAAGGSITIGTFSDPAMVPFQQVFLKKFTDETGIKVHYQQTNYNAWYQNSKTDGLQKTSGSR